MPKKGYSKNLSTEVSSLQKRDLKTAIPLHSTDGMSTEFFLISNCLIKKLFLCLSSSCCGQIDRPFPLRSYFILWKKRGL